jgi:hypothetical protein
MTRPSCFTPVSEIKVDWKRVVKRLPLHLRGSILEVDTKKIGLITSDYKFPVVVIPHANYVNLNGSIELVSSLTAALNDQLVHKFSGVKFIKPLEGKGGALIAQLIDAFDAEIINVSRNVCS